MLTITNKETGDVMEFNCDKQTIAHYALANAEMCMRIALGASDKHIEEHFDGEMGLLDVVERYLNIYDWAVREDG